MPGLKSLAARFKSNKSAKFHESLRPASGALFARVAEAQIIRPGQQVPNAVAPPPDGDIEQLLVAEAAAWRGSLVPPHEDYFRPDERIENVRKAAEALLTDMQGLVRRQSRARRRLDRRSGQSDKTIYVTAPQSVEDLLPESPQERAQTAHGSCVSGPAELGPWSVTSHAGDGENPYIRGEEVLLPPFTSIDWSRVDEQEVRWIFEACNLENANRHESGAVLPGASRVDSEADIFGKGKSNAMAELIDSVEGMLAAGQAASQRRKHSSRSVDSRDSPKDRGSETTVAGTSQHISDQTQASAPHRDCVVCGDAKPSLDFPPAAPSSSCTHPPRTCTSCLETWLDSEIATKGSVPEIKCPECPAKLVYIDLRRWASPQTFAKYDALTARAALTSLPDFSWCLTPGCGNGQLNVDNGNYMQCYTCGYKQCLLHLCPWHVGETCEQYTARNQKAQQDEIRSQTTLRNTTKICPGKNCGWRIEKKSGCDHVTCTKCRFAFCWQCLASHEEIKKTSNAAHKTWCKYHSENLEVAWPFNMH